jgi:hypothetical protein
VDCDRELGISMLGDRVARAGPGFVKYELPPFAGPAPAPGAADVLATGLAAIPD